MRNKKLILAFIIMLTINLVWAQDPARFQEEVETIGKRYDSLWDQSRKTIVFTGSSSIRFWENLPVIYPEYQVVNTGFGGSHTSDLLAFSEELILRYNPVKVFIYEGDNDLFDQKRPGGILRNFRKILARIWNEEPQVKIVLISTKPSLVRWHLKRAYKRLNRKIKRMAGKDPRLAYADVWSVMVQGRKLKKDLFIEDGLHMNEKGYAIWKQVLDPFVKQP